MIDPRQAAVGAYFRRRRQANDLTQENVADKLLVTTKTISDWENGREPPAFDNLMRLCDLIGADIREVQRLYLDRRVHSDPFDAIEAEAREILDAGDQAMLNDLLRPLRRFWLRFGPKPRSGP